MDNKLQKAIQLFQNKKFAKSQSILKKINTSNPTYTSLELEAVCLAEQKQFKLAAIKFEQSLSLASNKTEKTNAINNLASTYLKVKEWKLAAKYLEQIVALGSNTHSFEARANLTKCYYNLKEFEHLRAHADKLKTVSGYDSDAYCFVAIAQLCLEKNSDALETLTRMHQNISQYAIEKLIIITQLVEQKLTPCAYEKHISIIEQAFGSQDWVEKLKKPKNITKNASSGYAFPHIETSSPDVHHVLTEICKKTIALGGKFIEGVSLIEKNGELSVKLTNSDAASSDEVAISVPLKAAPLLSDYNISLDKNTLLASPKEQQINPSANEIMRLFISLYNLTNKISFWRKVNPIANLDLSHPALKQLTLSISKSHSFTKLIELESDELILKTFLDSRKFNYEQKHLKQAKILANRDVRGLLGVIDLLNHHSSAPGYKPAYKEQAIQVNSYTDSNNQLCVKYNHNDPLTSYFVYGYIDSSSMKALSIPLNATLSNGFTVFIDNAPNVKSNNLVDENIKDLKALYPEFIEKNENSLAISRIIFPEYKNKNSLIRVLTHIFQKHVNTEGVEYNTAQVNDLVDQLISQVRTANLIHWKKVKDLLNDSQLPKIQLDALLTLTEMHISLFDSYR